MPSDANTCKHAQLLLIVVNHGRVRCRYCHLTLSKDELGDGYCPECWEERHRRHYDFDPVETKGGPSVRYRCESCGVMLQPLNA